MSVIVLELQEQLFDLFLVSLLERVLEIVCERAVTGKEPSAVHAAESLVVRLYRLLLTLLLEMHGPGVSQPPSHFLGKGQGMIVMVVVARVVIIVVDFREILILALLLLVAFVHSLMCGLS